MYYVSHSRKNLPPKKTHLKDMLQETHPLRVCNIYIVGKGGVFNGRCTIV